MVYVVKIIANIAIGVFMENIVTLTTPSPLTFKYDETNHCNIDIHLHDTYEIYQALSSNVQYYVEGHSYKMASGDIILTSNKEIHRPITVDENPYIRRFIQFSPNIISTYTDLDYNPSNLFINHPPGCNNHISIAPGDKKVINSYFEAINLSLIKNTLKSNYESRLILMEMLMILEELYDKAPQLSPSLTEIDGRIEKIIVYLDQHYADSFDLDWFSKKHSMDKYYLSHVFKKNTGFTLMEYIQSKRILHAKFLLSLDLTMAEIGRRCGYEDYSNFFKTFKKLVNMSPKQYKGTLVPHPNLIN